MARADHYYRGIRGSAALATRPVLPDAVPAERLEPGEMRRVPFQGELLGAARVRAGYAPIPLDAFDRACDRLEAEEQAAYLHLLRLSYGEGRNWCRARKRDLGARVRLSERRLLRVLDALVAKRFARPLHRDNRGTLWRVFLPREAAGEPTGDDVLLGRATLAAVPERAPDDPPARARPSTPGPAAPTLRANGIAGHRVKGPPVPSPSPASQAAARASSLSAALAAARGDPSAAGLARAAREVRDLLDEGQSPERIAAAIETVRRRTAAKGAP